MKYAIVIETDEPLEDKKLIDLQLACRTLFDVIGSKSVRKMIFVEDKKDLPRGFPLTEKEKTS